MVNIWIDSEACKGCELCIRVCLKNLLEIDEEHINAKGYHPIHITKPEKCVACGSCALICPDNVFEIYK